MGSTITELLEAGADDSAAISGIGLATLSYGGLRQLAARTVQTLNDFGIGRGDRVAIVLPNGPDMASAFVCIACGATTAPLNPSYTRDEYDFYLADLDARALVVEKGSDSPAVLAAKASGIQVLELLSSSDGVAGTFELESESAAQKVSPDKSGFAQSGDVALILHTSGTTSRPKIVPLSQENLCASARNIQQTLKLVPDDVCLNVMPLFHIHGLVAAILATLGKGAAVCCAPGFDALRFFAWLDEANPTWYTAVPTMHQAILLRASRADLGNSKLRFIRSSSSSLPPQVLAELEDCFGVPVVRGIRHDRGRAPDDLQSIATGYQETRDGRLRSGPGGRNHG